MRIVLDLQGAQGESRIRGIGRYSLALAKAIVRNRGKHEVMLLLNGMLAESIEPIRAAFDGLLPQESIRLWHATGPTNSVRQDNASRRYVAEWIREAFIAGLAPDVVHVSSFFEGFGDEAIHSIGRTPWRVPTAVTLYDLIPLLKERGDDHPDPAFEAFYHERLAQLRLADTLLCISESTQREATAHLDSSRPKTMTIGAAVDEFFRPVEVTDSERQELFARLKLSRKLVMYSGATDPRKNHLRLIEAFALLPEDLRRQYQLLIVGKLPDVHADMFRARARQSGLTDDELIISGRVSDEDLRRLYSVCTLFVFPSLHEGFGLPVLEAMSCGAPVIASGLTSLPEILGREDALFDPYDVHSIASKMRTALEDEAFRNTLIRGGLERSRLYSWDITACKAIAAFEDLHANAKKSAPPLRETIIETGIGHFAGQRDLGAGAFVDIASAMAQTFPCPAPPQLLVDVSELAKHDSRTGIQRVVRSILSELTTRPPNGYVVRPVYACTETAGYRHASGFLRHFLGKESSVDTSRDMIVSVQPGDVFLGLDLQHLVVMRQADVYRAWRRMGVEVYFIVYDLLPLRLPDFFAIEMHDAHNRWLEVLADMDGIVAISRSVADEIEQWLVEHQPSRHRPLRLGWFHLGGDIESSRPTTGFPPEASLVFQAMRDRPTFLMVGTLEPRKGYSQVIDAFDILWSRGIKVNLILAGKLGWSIGALVSKVRDHPLRNDQLYWIEGPSDEFLQKLYDRSSALIAASEGEGFGLPLIEAARHDLKIIARDIPVFHEVAGDHAYYFSGRSGAELADNITDWLALNEQNNVPQSTGMPHLSWAQSRDQLMDVVLNGNWYRTWM